MSNTLVILHFLPLEGYPPIMNLLDYFSTKKSDKKIICISSKGLFKNAFKNDQIKLYKFGKLTENRIILWLSYFIYNSFSIILLLLLRPKNILYYETISSFPAYIYKRYINKNASIFIHYHEYVTKKEYKTGSSLNKYLHQLEQSIYHDVKWISHTNAVRLNKFLDDNNFTYNNNKHKINPNYPSEKWAEKTIVKQETTPLKLIFIGYSIDPKGCFINELIDWLKKNEKDVILDIYCLKKESFPIDRIGKQKNLTINIFDPIPYNKIPSILKKYHVGLILYKGLTQNYIHNAPNKLFEYFACGLDIWFPKEMHGCYSYETDNSYPKIIKLDFDRLDQINLNHLIDRTELPEKTSIYYYENIYNLLYKELVSNE